MNKHNHLIPGLHESREEALARAIASNQAIPEVETLPHPNSSRLKKGIRAAGAVLVVAGVTAAAGSKTTARTINSLINRNANTYSTPSPPKPGEGTAIKIGDVISYRTQDGKVHERRVNMLSDISLAANAVNPDINQNTFNAMLENENHGSSLVHGGDTFTIDSSLAITDIGSSG